MLGQSKQYLPQIVKAPLLLSICATWTVVCLGRLYLPVISEGGLIGVNGRWFVSYLFGLVTVLYVNF